MPIRILLADDHPSVREALSALLEAAEGLTVVGEAGDAASTLEQAQHLSPDVILLDVHMPGGTGMQLARELAFAQPHVPVIALSLLRDAVIVKAMVESGVRGYVLKDDAHAQLVQAVRAVHAGARYFSEGLSFSEG